MEVVVAAWRLPANRPQIQGIEPGPEDALGWLMNKPRNPSKSRRLPRYKSLSIVGAGLGVLAFLGVAMLPSLVYGGAAGLKLVDGVFGSHPGHATRTDAFILGGILAAVTSVGFLFAVLGAAVGASVGALTSAAVARVPAEPARDAELQRAEPVNKNETTCC
jgi:hypothetical protein